MNTYIYCPRRSGGALELVRALGATRVRRFDGESFWDKKTRIEIQPNDIIVCWGTTFPKIDDVRTLNGGINSFDKYTEWSLLYNAGLQTVMVRRGQDGEDHESFVKAGYLPRSKNHQGGADFLLGVARPDFWAYREEFKNEYRIHSFAGRSIRAGIKIPREGFEPVVLDTMWKPESNMVHPWVRSFDGGWRVNYDGFVSTIPMRNLAHKAVKALGLTFGAVDIGENPDGTLKVIEVNSAPGVEGGTTAAYVRAITKWINEVEVAPEAGIVPLKMAKRALKRERLAARGQAANPAAYDFGRYAAVNFAIPPPQFFLDPNGQMVRQVVVPLEGEEDPE